MPDFSHLGKVPQHLAIIMDGNNRWARERRLGGVAGHKAGVRSLRTTVEHAARAGVQVLSLYAFSSENWRRPEEEVKGLMELFSWALTREIYKLVKNNLRLRIIGDRSGFAPAIQDAIERAEHLTRGNTGMLIVVAANYGGQWDITQAARRLAGEVEAGQLRASQITESMLAEYLALSDLPPPDLCIRTAGEQRLSNFMLWQLAYAELHFSPVLWPDFDADALYTAFADYARRQRRFGGRESEPTAVELKHYAAE
ncbi:di-trans,poly-cis-decaprenylcistransferase [Natronospirillum operosum]|uniref:Ditrans,polycis-undecaprenyl-diphosphate synthase ((2E,6E)-farnesyl-diphosphate specific) n=1 Tax=Natronospirillum operosum TaxID=2759953 RepID=A0A4Z0WBF0_9GAMM|nr:polyprenyl diphosphate synthase [Natronospirillum operosum]TGG95124.1 di-trans,poly-cis-decaprenylcistransferase [Natronospirillum operosum]